MTTTLATCLICALPFESRTSYGLCPLCTSRDKLREYDRWQSAVRHTQRDRLPCTLTLVQWLAAASDFRGLCAYCQEYTFSRIEMVNPVEGLTWSNVVPACTACSTHKRNGFEKAAQRVQVYLTANLCRSDDDINLEYVHEVEYGDESLV